MIGRWRMRAVDGDNVHARQHLVEAVPIGRLQGFLDLRRHATAVVIVDLEPEGLGSPSYRLANSSHADDAEPLAKDAMAEHPSRRPAMPFAVASTKDGRALGQAPRYRNDQRHGHVGSVLGQHAWRIGNDDRAVPRSLEVDIVDAGPELSDELEVGPGLA